MGSPSELSLDYKLDDPKAAAGAQPEQNQKIQEFLARLEEERHKIEVFKRELPLCMQLLNNAIEIYKQQLQECLPLKRVNVDGSDKANWMVSAQLWSPPEDAAKQQAAPPPKEADVSPNLALDTTKQRSGGAFLPFSREKSRGARAASAEVVVVEEKKCADLENQVVNTRRHSEIVTPFRLPSPSLRPLFAGCASPAMYAAHAAPVPREFYSPVPHHHYHHLHYPPLGLGASAPAAHRGRTAGSPEPDVRSGGERSESIEEEEEVRKRVEEEEEDEAPASEEKALVPLMVKADDDDNVALKI
ncbi:hypothetical protein BHE74_00030821 [Ensete ventricosum]|nr:hypothetical protein BHE74_00030821 [Ensete ventricosum]